MNQNIKSIINYINLGAALFLTASMIFGFYKYHLLGFYAFFLSYFLEIFIERKWKNIHFDKYTFYYLIMFFFFFLAFIYYPFEKSHIYFETLINYRFSLFGFAIIGIFGINNKYKLNYFLYTFFITSIVIILYLILYRIGLVEFITNHHRNYLFEEARNIYANNHKMFNFFLNISLVSIWYTAFKLRKKIIDWKFLPCILAFLLIFYALFISEGRSGFLAGIIITCAIFFFEIIRRWKKIGYLSLLIIPFVVFFLFSNHERVSSDSMSNEPRLILWKDAIDVIKQKPILGHGISDAQVKYDNIEYKHNDINFRNYIAARGPNVRVDSHNQYLQTTMEFGIFGLILLLTLYIYPVLVNKSEKRMLALLFMFLSAFLSFFEIFITGQLCVIFCILTMLLLLIKEEKNIKTEISE